MIRWPAFIAHLEKVAAPFSLPMCDIIIAEYGPDPFLILISCLLSLRARDVVTIHVCRRLFAQIRTPRELLNVPLEELESIIHKTGFYKNKARVLRAVSATLLEHYHGTVPSTESELRALYGVGQKTANLVLSLAFGIPAMCVDTHVHRISNLWNLIHTKNPDESEKALKQVVPRAYWISWNRLLVTLGQNLSKQELLQLKPTL